MENLSRRTGPSRQLILLQTNGTTINPKAFERLNISRSDQTMISGSAYFFHLPKTNAETISKFTNVTDVTPYMQG